MTRQVRERRPSGPPMAGQRFEVTVGPVAHGGHFVARHEGLVVFVRHALEGERVVAEVTDGYVGDSFVRADAIEVLSPSPHRTHSPCPYAGPGLCGGCDFQHVTLTHQRELKAAVVREQFGRLAGLDVTVRVEAVPGDDRGLHWRTRMQWARPEGGRPGDGRLGLRKHRSRDVVVIDECLIAAPGARTVVEGVPVSTEPVVEQVGGHRFTVAGDGFWQVHPGAPDALCRAVLDVLKVEPGERAVDLYAGVGLFSAFLAEAVGAAGGVHAIEGDRVATAHAADNLAQWPWATVSTGRVDQSLVAGLAGERADVVVLDPPREGAKRKAVGAIAGLAPRAIAYVACDPAALARDVAFFAEFGYSMTEVRAFDLFPMMHHVECVALLVKSDSGLR